ncbi:MAG: T9SS type B sorting domain-containing protein, partial [Bacteroidota bacterium]
LNEIFKPKVIGVHDYSYLIFDRWGTKIFETTNTEEGWNGHFKNKLCKSDVYVYKITFEDDVENGFHQYIGKVTLVR